MHLHCDYTPTEQATTLNIEMQTSYHVGRTSLTLQEWPVLHPLLRLVAANGADYVAAATLLPTCCLRRDSDVTTLVVAVTPALWRELAGLLFGVVYATTLTDWPGGPSVSLRLDSTAGTAVRLVIPASSFNVLSAYSSDHVRVALLDRNRVFEMDVPLQTCSQRWSDDDGGDDVVGRDIAPLTCSYDEDENFVETEAAYLPLLDGIVVRRKIDLSKGGPHCQLQTILRAEGGNGNSA